MVHKLYFNITVKKKKKAPGSHSFLGMCLYLAFWLEDSWLPPSAFEASLLLSCLESLSLSLKKKKIELSFSFDSQLGSLLNFGKFAILGEKSFFLLQLPTPIPPAAAAAKSLQSCPTLCDSIDGSPPGSPIPGILQARTLEWVAISFSRAGK